MGRLVSGSHQHGCSEGLDPGMCKLDITSTGGDTGFYLLAVLYVVVNIISSSGAYFVSSLSRLNVSFANKAVNNTRNSLFVEFQLLSDFCWPFAL